MTDTGKKPILYGPTITPQEVATTVEIIDPSPPPATNETSWAEMQSSERPKGSRREGGHSAHFLSMVGPMDPTRELVSADPEARTVRCRDCGAQLAHVFNRGMSCAIEDGSDNGVCTGVVHADSAGEWSTTICCPCGAGSVTVGRVKNRETARSWKYGVSIRRSS